MDRTLLKALGYPPHKAAVIPNRMDAGTFPECDNFVVRDGKKSVLCVARFDAGKRHEDLHEAGRWDRTAGQSHYAARMTAGATEPESW